MKNTAYELRNNIRRLSYMERGDSYDLKAFESPDTTDVCKVYEDRSLILPNPVFFYLYSKIGYIKELDSLSSLETQCIYSRRMIDTLLSVREFKYHLYPIAVLEEGAIKFQKNPDGYKIPQPYSDIELFKAKSIRDDLFILQTLEFIDVFDWEKSNYRKYDEKDVSPGIVKEYVFKTPSGGFPPLFRLPYQPAHLFISNEAREALKRAGIRGTAYGLLHDTWRWEVDVPIP